MSNSSQEGRVVPARVSSSPSPFGEQPELPVVSALKARRVLVIEKNAKTREEVRASMRHLGHWLVLEALSSSEGITTAILEQPDVILLDLDCQEANGFWVLRQLRDNPSTCTIPIVLLTSQPERIDLSLMSSAGILQVLSKPFEPILLAQQVAEACHWEEAFDG